MTRPVQLLCSEGDPALLAQQLDAHWSRGHTVALAAALERQILQEALPTELPDGWGPAVVLGTGGSSGRRRWCLQPLAHLEAAADATGHWLLTLGLDPTAVELFNPLPLHHISGLMPLVRARRWGAPLRCLAAAVMRDPARLAVEQPLPAGRRAVLSLVPLQLQRLIEHPAGLAWLRGFALIWVGGAGLAPGLAEQGRREGLRLSPCYGSTETGAMVCALPPEQFLAGVAGCGLPLPHGALQLDPHSGALQIRASSLAAGFVEEGQWRPLPLDQGWWTSGDRAALPPEGVQLLGRLDGAINTGGETVFPEQVEQRLRQLAQADGLPLEALLLVGCRDAVWGERLVALVRPGEEGLCERLALLARELPPSQRPQRWLRCPDLAPTALGKWERGRWSAWAASPRAAESPP
jgi:O-succinylbenzoic acid--CoA ligase